MTLENKTILVLGGSGFIGSHLCDALIKKNPKKLIILDNLSSSKIDNIQHLLYDKRVQFINGDINDIGQLVDISDVIFNLAASNVGNSIIAPDTDLKSNIIGVFNLVQSLKDKPNTRIIHVSSGSVVNPSTPYAISKQAGENYALFFAKQYGLKLSVVRPFHVYGERQDPNGKCGVINIFLKRIAIGEAPIVWGSGDQIKNFTYVSDTVNGILKVAESEDTIGKVYDIASDNLVSIKELAELLITKYSSAKDMKPVYEQPKVGENARLYPNTEALKALGWKTEIGFEVGLNKCNEWVRENL